MVIHFESGDVGLGDDFQMTRGDRSRNRGDGCGTFRVHGTTAAVAVAVVHAGRSALVRLRIHGSWSRKRMPAESARGRSHRVKESGAAQRRHGIISFSRALENIAYAIDLTVDVSRFSRDADFVFHFVVVRLEF